MRITVCLILVALVAATSAAQDSDLERLERGLQDPPATGVLVTNTAPGTQAEEIGLRVGDVVVSYGGYPVPDLPTLTKAKTLIGEVQWVEMEIVSAAGKRTVRVRPGPIGFNGLAVKKGIATEALPKDTGVTFDFSALAKGPWDDWYEFHLPGGGKVGFEHVRLSLVGGKLIMRREVAFDGGEAWGLNHFDVTTVVTAEGRPQAVATQFKNPLTDWVGIGRASGGVWKVVWPDLSREEELPTGEPVIPSYLVETLAAFMPREEGACFTFRTMNEGMGQIGLPAALVCVGRETLGPGGKSVPGWRYEQRLLTGLGGTYWIADGPRAHALRVDYGGAQAVHTTKEAALRDLHPDLKVQSGN